MFTVPDGGIVLEASKPYFVQVKRSRHALRGPVLLVAGTVARWDGTTTLVVAQVESVPTGASALGKSTCACRGMDPPAVHSPIERWEVSLNAW